MKNLFFKILLASIFVSIYACENDIELNAPYKETTIIFGVLDIGADTQFIRINKTFLGDGNALDMAQVKDSSEYDPTTVNAYLLKNDATPNENNRLEYITIVQREPGVFYDQNVIVYYSTRPLLEEGENYQDVTYHLEVQIGEKIVKASTNLVSLKNSELLKPENNANNGNPASIQLKNASQFRDIDIKVNPPKFAKRIEANYRFNYVENYNDGSALNNSIVYNLGSLKTNRIDGSGDDVSFSVNSEEMYSFIGGSTLPSSNIKFRAIQNLECSTTISAEDLSTYIDINQPVSGIVTERPAFTNIENGLGIFSSKFTLKRSLSVGSLTNSGARANDYQEFLEGNYTNGFCFCDTLTGTTYNCNSIIPCN